MNSPAKLPFERLDRSRAFGTVIGPTEPHKIAYSQVNFGLEFWPYDAHENLIEAALQPEQKKLLDDKRAAKAKTPEPEIEDEPQAVVETAPPPPPPDEHEDINLSMWLRGQIRYRPNEVQKAVRARYHVNKNTNRDLAMFLVEEPNGPHLIPRGEVSEKLLPRPAMVED